MSSEGRFSLSDSSLRRRMTVHEQVRAARAIWEAENSRSTLEEANSKNSANTKPPPPTSASVHHHHQQPANSSSASTCPDASSSSLRAIAWFQRQKDQDHAARFHTQRLPPDMKARDDTLQQKGAEQLATQYRHVSITEETDANLAYMRRARGGVSQTYLNTLRQPQHHVAIEVPSVGMNREEDLPHRVAIAALERQAKAREAILDLLLLPDDEPADVVRVGGGGGGADVPLSGSKATLKQTFHLSSFADLLRPYMTTTSSSSNNNISAMRRDTASAPPGASRSRAASSCTARSDNASFGCLEDSFATFDAAAGRRSRSPQVALPLAPSSCTALSVTTEHSRSPSLIELDQSPPPQRTVDAVVGPAGGGGASAVDSQRVTRPLFVRRLLSAQAAVRVPPETSQCYRPPTPALLQPNASSSLLFVSRPTVVTTATMALPQFHTTTDNHSSSTHYPTSKSTVVVGGGDAVSNFSLCSSNTQPTSGGMMGPARREGDLTSPPSSSGSFGPVLSDDDVQPPPANYNLKTQNNNAMLGRPAGLDGVAEQQRLLVRANSYHQNILAAGQRAANLSKLLDVIATSNGLV